MLDLDSSANASPRFTAAGDLGEAGGEDYIRDVTCDDFARWSRRGCGVPRCRRFLRSRQSRCKINFFT
jgi:hypothetical protein